MFKSVKKLFVLFSFICLIVPLKVNALESENVKDYLNYLSSEEIELIQDDINEVKEKYNMDVVVVTTDNVGYKTSRQYAEDFYDDNGYGLDYDNSGILMLVNMKDREVWFTTTGRGMSIFDDKKIEKMVKVSTSKLKKENYYDAIDTYINKVEMYLKVENGFLYKIIYSLGKLKTYIISLVVTIVIVIMKVMSHYDGDDAVTEKTYMNINGFKLNNKEDKFVNSNVTKILKRDTSNDNSSGSSGSSGCSHGGGGGQF